MKLYRIGRDFMADSKYFDCLGVYPVSKSNRDRLNGLTFQRVTYDEKQRSTIFIFTDEYRKVNIDLLFTGHGELYISDFYGSDMNRDEIIYIKLY